MSERTLTLQHYSKLEIILRDHKVRTFINVDAGLHPDNGHLYVVDFGVMHVFNKVVWSYFTATP